MEYITDCENEECGSCEGVQIDIDLYDSPMEIMDENVAWVFEGECCECGHTHTVTVYAKIHTYEVAGE